MTRAAAIGEEVRLAGYGLAGVDVRPAEDARAVASAWEGLDAGVVCLILTPAAHRALESRLPERPELVWAVVPE
jgi:hypothetical protein